MNSRREDLREKWVPNPKRPLRKKMNSAARLSSKAIYIYIFLPSDSISPHHNKGFPGGSVVKNLPARTGDSGDMGSIPGSGRSPRGGHGNPLQYSCWDNPMDRGAWWATVCGVTKNQTLLKRLSMHIRRKVLNSFT